jgi:Gamma-glutamyl cyclotransferase, AIG2-like
MTFGYRMFLNGVDYDLFFFYGTLTLGQAFGVQEFLAKYGYSAHYRGSGQAEGFGLRELRPKSGSSKKVTPTCTLVRHPRDLEIAYATGELWSVEKGAVDTLDRLEGPDGEFAVPFVRREIYIASAQQENAYVCASAYFAETCVPHPVISRFAGGPPLLPSSLAYLGSWIRSGRWSGPHSQK